MCPQKRLQTGALTVAGIVAIAAIVGLLVLGFSLYAYVASIRNQALAWETDLNKVVRIEVSERATYETSIYEQAGLAEIKSEKMNSIIRGAIEGRYGDNPGNPGQGKALLQAVRESYPDTKGLEIYDRILPAISAGREGIRNKQNLRIEKAQAYDYWRKEGIFRAWVLSGIYPSRDLQFKVGDKMYYAAEALEKMTEPISTADVNKSFESGLESPLQLNKK